MSRMSMNNEIMGNSITMEYIGACEEVRKYLLLSACEPPKTYNRYKDALHNYRMFLDDLSCKMPKAKFPYDKDDKSTWRYLEDPKDKEKKVSRKFTRNLINHEWKYKDA